MTLSSTSSGGRAAAVVAGCVAGAGSSHLWRGDDADGGGAGAVVDIVGVVRMVLVAVAVAVASSAVAAAVVAVLLFYSRRIEFVLYQQAKDPPFKQDMLAANNLR